MSSERKDLREVKDYLVEKITDEQKLRGMAVPRPDLATKFIEDQKIIEHTERSVPENPHRNDPLQTNEHTPDIERNILSDEQALAKVRAKYGKDADVRIWLAAIRQRDQQFNADFLAIFADPFLFAMNPDTHIAMFTPLGRDKFQRLIADAILKYGDPRKPTKRIQVGAAPAPK